MLPSLRRVRLLPTAVPTFGTPVIGPIHFATVSRSFPACPALCARVPCARSCRRRLRPSP
jgi:hypothetical protein